MSNDDYGPPPSRHGTDRHSGGRSCPIMLGVPVVAMALALKLLKVKRGKR